MWKIKQARYGVNAGKFYAYRYVLTNEDFDTQYFGSLDGEPVYYEHIETLVSHLQAKNQRYTEEYVWLENLRELQNA